MEVTNSVDILLALFYTFFEFINMINILKNERSLPVTVV
jgi:hypothetical protein